MTGTGWGVCAGALFAALWGLWGAAALPAAWRRRAAVIVLMASAGVVARAVMTDLGLERGSVHFDVGLYAGALALSLATAVLAWRLLRAPADVGWRPPVLAAIAGLHALGLWAATGLRVLIGVALGMVAASLIAAGWSVSGNRIGPRQAITGLGCALVLWGACLSSLF